jgi:PST family polysaccharide transporter
MNEPTNPHLATAHLAADMQKRTLAGGVTTLAGRAARVLVEGTLIVTLSRLLPPSDFGLVGMALSVTRFVQLFKDLGLNLATVQRDEITQDQVSVLFWINAGTGILLSLLVAACAPLVAAFYGRPELSAITAWFGLGLAFAGVSAQHLAVLRRQMRFGALAIAELVGAVIGLAVALALALLGYGYWALVANAVLAAAASALAAWLLCAWRPGRPRSFTGVRGLVAFGAHVMGVNVSNYFARNLDDILIGKTMGAHALGLYQRAYDLVMLPVVQICVPLGQVAQGALSRLQRDADAYRLTFMRLFSVLLFINVPLGAWLVSIADVGLPLLLGSEWRESARLFALLGAMLAIQPVGHATSWLLITQGRSAELLRWSLISNATTALIFVVSIRYGVEAVAAAYSISGLVFRLPLNVWISTRVGPVKSRDVVGTFLVYVFASALVLAAVTAARQLVSLGPIATLALSLPLAAVATVAGLLPFATGRRALAAALQAGRRVVQRKPPSGEA